MIGRLLSHYRIEKKLGAGGMGEVYLATDLALGRQAALKFLPEDFDPALRDRLVREAEACARLQHPAIATFLEAGEEAGSTWLAMEYVPGQTLRARLGEGPLPVEAALSVTACILEALAHSHAAGILHRDIKPENIMLAEQGCPKLLDFGLAKSMPRSEEADTTQTRLTLVGAVPGTPGYLSPEQIRGEPLDARSDLFAVGALLYEMVSGKAAFPGANTVERLASVLTREIDPIPAQCSRPGLEMVIERSLQRNPARRYASAGEFLADLRRIAEGELPTALPESLAILDLENLTRDAESEWIGSGIAESLAADLGRASRLEVLPREKVLKARAELGSAGGRVGAREVGLRLGCRWVLSGSFQRLGEALRILLSLTEVSTGRAVPAAKADGTLQAMFAMQDSLAEQSRALLEPERTQAPEKSVLAKSLGAFEAYSRGRRFWHRLEKGSFDRARELYEEAISLSPAYAPALAGLAAIHALRFTFTTDPGELAQAAEYALRATAADAATGEAHVWLGYARLRQGRMEEALDQFGQAMRHDPASSYAPYFAGAAHSCMGHHREATVQFQRAVEVDPSHGYAWVGLGWSHLESGKLDEAEWCFSRAMALEGGRAVSPTVGAEGFLAEARRLRGDCAAARELCLKALASIEQSDHMLRDTHRAFTLCVLGRSCLDRGEVEAAQAAYQQALAQLEGRPRALGAGLLAIQALAGLARCGQPERLREAARLVEERGAFDYSWFYGATAALAGSEMAAAAQALGEVVDSEAIAAALRRV